MRIDKFTCSFTGPPTLDGEALDAHLVALVRLTRNRAKAAGYDPGRLREITVEASHAVLVYDPDTRTETSYEPLTIRVVIDATGINGKTTT